MGTVLQDTGLFKGTVREKVLYRRLGATEEELYAPTGDLLRRHP